MVHSMTAFARVEKAGAQGTLSWELRSVNSRYLEPHLRLPESFRDLEGAVREALRQGISRGKLECTLRFTEETTGKPLQVDRDRAAQLVAAAETIAGLIKQPAALNPLEVLAWPGVLVADAADPQALNAEALALFNQGLKELKAGREREGAELARLINERLTSIEADVVTLRELIPQMLATQRQKVLDRFTDMKADLDPTRLEQEMVLLAQKSDVAEELDRLSTHILEVRRVLKAQDWGNAAQIAILDALLKLRQVCCDPRLLRGTSVHPDTERAKLEHLEHMLPELVEDGRRILLFSQFTSMLRLVAELLDALAIPYLMLTGETAPSEREHIVAQYQKADGNAPPILLASLKAGGTGLNLTAADTVIHLDPWWNPAVQEQATARAHRIGQTQPVFVYRIVVQGSIEERMLELQERKRVLAQGVLGSDMAGAIKFSADELAGLLAPLAEPANNPLAILSAETKRWGGTGRRGLF